MKILLQSPGRLRGGPEVWTNRFITLLENRGYEIQDDINDEWEAALWITRSTGIEKVPNRTGVIGFRVANGYHPEWFNISGKKMQDKHHAVNASIALGLQKANIIIYQSNWAKKTLDEILIAPENEYVIIPNGVDLIKFKPGLNNQDDVPVLGTVGFFRYRYRLATFFEMSRRLKIPHKLLVIGPLDKECQEVMSLANKESSLRSKLDYHPFIPPHLLPDYYRRMSVLVHPVMGDVCPNVVVEALACGVPVVAPEFGGTAELINQGGITFNSKRWVYDDSFTNQIVDSVIKVLEKQEIYSKQARLQAVNHLDDQNMVDRYLEVLNLQFKFVRKEPNKVYGEKAFRDFSRKLVLPTRYFLASSMRKGLALTKRYKLRTGHGTPKIAFTLFDFQVGGIENWLYRLAKHLQDQFDFYFLSTKVKTFSPKFSGVGTCRFIPNPTQMISYLIKEQIDLVQVHNERWPIDAALAAGVPRIIERLGGKRSWRRVPKYGLDMVIASSFMAANNIKDLISEDRIQVIYNGVNLDEIDAEIPSRLFSQDTFIVGRTTRFGLGQNLGLLVQAINALRSTRPNLRLALVGGDSPLPGATRIEKELLGIVEKMDLNEIVKFSGPIENPIPTIKGFDIATCVSNDEGIPNSLIEAMACRKPVISTDVGAVRELIEEGINGLIIPPNDLDALVFTIQRLMEDSSLFDKLAESGRQTIEEKFNIANSADHYAQLYFDLLGK